MAEFQVAPEQAGQSAGQAAQRRVVNRRLAFPQVVDDQGADRLAGDGITVDQLVDCQLPGRLECPDGGRCRRREGPQGMQQLVEVRAGVAAAIGKAGQQFQAVADGDAGDHAALGGQERGDPARRQVLGGRAGRVGTRQHGERGEAGRVAGPGHLGCEVFRGLGTEQPRQAGPDDITADQREYPAAKGDEVGPGVTAGPAGAAEPCRSQLPPRQVARGVGAAGQPPVLPGAAGLLLQPVHQLGQADPPAGLHVVPVGGERGREQPAPQAQHDVGVRQRGGPTDIFEAGP